nr:hypothetical protein [Candidatus Nanopelagicales bacterium]
VAAATGRTTIPHLGPEWPQVSAYLPQRQRVQVKQTGHFHRTEAAKPHRVYDEQIAADPSGWVLYGAYQSHVRHLLKAGLLTGGAVAWSLWDGYLTEPSGTTLTSMLAAAGVPLIHHHTSGHASPTDLRRLVEALKPKVIVPIHTEAPDRYAVVLGRQATPHSDGEWWSVTSS